MAQRRKFSEECKREAVGLTRFPGGGTLSSKTPRSDLRGVYPSPAVGLLLCRLLRRCLPGNFFCRSLDRRRFCCGAADEHALGRYSLLLQGCREP